MFRLTDPCIHSNRRGKFGRTDHGKGGHTNFFKTHKCNAACKLLGIDQQSRTASSRCVCHTQLLGLVSYVSFGGKKAVFTATCSSQDWFKVTAV